MKLKLGVSDVLWMAAGAALLLVALLLVWHFRAEDSPAEMLAVNARRVGLVDGMSLDLALASEAEKSAVMSADEQEARTYADQARAATVKAEGKRKELESLLDAGGGSKEKTLLEEFSKAFGEFQGVDRELLSLAVQGTNLKASSLAFGPAAAAVEEMTAALSRIVAQTEPAHGESAALLALGAEARALHLLTLLPPHIAEESDTRMDELEALMDKDDQEIRRDLDALVAELAAEIDVQKAVSAYATFGRIRADILTLSRANTNVRSLELSLHQKRKALALCNDALAALKQALLEEATAGVGVPPPNPRRLGGEPPLDK